MADVEPDRSPAGVRGLRDHPQRRVLNDELHARPAEPLTPPLRLTHLAMLSGENAADVDRAHVARLCRAMNVVPPGDDAVQFMADLGTVRMRWERHTEFSTYTFYREGLRERPFADPAIEAVPSDWINRLPGERLVAIQLAFGEGELPGPDAASMPPEFGHARVVGGTIADGRASVWTDFRIHGDGYSRMLVRAHGIGATEAGYHIRRLLEIETYRMTALLVLPTIRRVGPRLGDVEHGLADITAEMRRRDDVTEADERDYLDRLTALAAETEHIAAEANYRISAATAYHSLMERRLQLLREGRLPDLEPIGDYLERRLRPAMDTANAVRRRTDDLAERVGRANALLRTRLDVKQTTQSRDLLESMNRRAGLQLRLEQTVEVITVIAGAYYLSGLVREIGYGIAHTVPGAADLPVEAIVGVAAPVLLIGLWALIRHVRRRIERGDAHHKP